MKILAIYLKKFVAKFLNFGLPWLHFSPATKAVLSTVANGKRLLQVTSTGSFPPSSGKSIEPDCFTNTPEGAQYVMKQIISDLGQIFQSVQRLERDLSSTYSIQLEQTTHNIIVIDDLGSEVSFRAAIGRANIYLLEALRSLRDALEYAKYLA